MDCVNRVNLKRLQAAEEQLQKQIRTLQLLYEETSQAEKKIKDMAYMEKTRRSFLRSKEALEENIRVLISMAAVLQKARIEYCRTEGRITDRYNLDIVIYPQVRFETSRITGMEEYRSLMPF